MKIFFIGIFLGVACLSLSAQENDYYRQGESLISIRNPKLGLQGRSGEWVRIMGSHLDYGYFCKDHWLMGGGAQMFFNRLGGSSNDYYSLGLQLFSRYYFSPLGKKQQFIFFAEPRIEGIRTFSQKISSGGDFAAASDLLNISAGLYFAWRPHHRVSFDIGLQSQVSWGKASELGIETTDYIGFNPNGILSINFHL